MLKKTSRFGVILFALILVAGVLVLATGCKKGPNLKGASIKIARWSNPYDVNTYQPQSETEERQLEFRKKLLADNGFTMEEVQLSGWDDFFPIVLSNILSGNREYSMYCLPADWAMTLYKQGLLAPLNQGQVVLNNREEVAGEKTAWNKMMEDLFTFGGKQYSVTPGLGGFSWQGNFIFFNKRLLREAGLDPNLPFDLQRDGKWTWDAFLDICRKTTRDTNNDGITDIYALPGDDCREIMFGFVYGNNGNFITIDSNGRYQNATNRPEFIEALALFQQLINEGLMKPRTASSEWGWNFAEFFDGRTAMVFDPEWRQGQLPEMSDDYGIVLAPKGPRATNYRTSLTEIVFVIPSFFSQAEVDVILKAFDLWETPMDTDWRQGYYPFHRDRRSVDETMALQKEPGIAVYRDFAIIPGYPIDQMLQWEPFWEKGTPSQIVETWAPWIQAVLND
jgi:ABC-type glycerol-3-phosphate transport system substrate-binding protein